MCANGRNRWFSMAYRGCRYLHRYDRLVAMKSHENENSRLVTPFSFCLKCTDSIARRSIKTRYLLASLGTLDDAWRLVLASCGTSSIVEEAFHSTRDNSVSSLCSLGWNIAHVALRQLSRSSHGVTSWQSAYLETAQHVGSTMAAHLRRYFSSAPEVFRFKSVIRQRYQPDSHRSHAASRQWSLASLRPRRGTREELQVQDFRGGVGMSVVQLEGSWRIVRQQEPADGYP